MGKRYRGNHGDDISKLFVNEAREKKKIGANIFKRASTRKGGGNQALRTPYFFMTNKEKRELNGEVKTLDMNKVQTLGEFLKNDIVTQKRLMEHWRKKYKIVDIRSKMGVSNSKYYEIINDLGIEKDKTASNALFIELSDDDVEKFKNYSISDVPSHEELLKINPQQRNEILEVYFNKFTTTELCDKWDLIAQRIYTMKSQVKAYNRNIAQAKQTPTPAQEEPKQEQLEFENTAEEEVKPTEQPLQTEKSIEEDLGYKKYMDLGKLIADLEKEKSVKDDKFFFSINQSTNSESIIKKLNMLIGLLDDEEEYELSLTVRQK